MEYDLPNPLRMVELGLYAFVGVVLFMNVVFPYIHVIFDVLALGITYSVYAVLGIIAASIALYIIHEILKWIWRKLKQIYAYITAKIYEFGAWVKAKINYLNPRYEETDLVVKEE